MLAALPEKDLIARMGQEGKRLRQLALGNLPHLFLPVEPASRLEEYRELDSPVEILDSLLFVVGVMLEQLILRASFADVGIGCADNYFAIGGGWVPYANGAARFTDNGPAILDQAAASGPGGPSAAGTYSFVDADSGAGKHQQGANGIVFSSTA